MSNSGPLNAPTRLPAVHPLAAEDRKVAYYLGMVRGSARRAAQRLAAGGEAAEVLGELLARLGRMVDEVERATEARNDRVADLRHDRGGAAAATPGRPDAGRRTTDWTVARRAPASDQATRAADAPEQGH